MNLMTTHLPSHPMYAKRAIDGDSKPSAEQKKALGLDDFLVPNPSSTILFRARDDALQSRGIFKGDLLVVDRSIKPEKFQIILVLQNGELCLNYFDPTRSIGLDVPEGDISQSTNCTDPYIAGTFQIWGVVTYCLHRLCEKLSLPNS
jgi:DNA polymerase V